MSQVSKRIVHKSIQERLIQNLLELFADIKKTSEAKMFIEDFFSRTEKIMFAKRMAIAILLSKGYSSRDISSLLKVSTATVNSISRFVNSDYQGYKLIISKYNSKQSTKELFREIERYFYRLNPGKAFIEEDLIKTRLGHKPKLF